MKRKAYEYLIQWKIASDRKPLILEGARQVGKTWLLKEFGKKEFENLVYINCDNNPQLKDIFYDFNIKRIVQDLSVISNTRIEAGKTLVFFDEVQEEPAVLTSLKYFYELMPSLHVAAAGSLLGIHVHKGTGFPVGCVNRLKIYPLSFVEFLNATGNELITEYIEKNPCQSLNTLRIRLSELLRQYYFIGGMPEVVQSFIDNGDYSNVRKKQNEILSGYEEDISKHAEIKDIAKIGMVWHSLPSQLAKENKKFLYGCLKTGGRAKEFENAIQWLINAGLVYKVSRVKKLELPLKFYEDIESFKLFINDLGLLGAMADVPASQMLIGKNIFSSFKGSFTEQFVCQQYLNVFGESPFYYSKENSTLELDFVVQQENLYVIEVKAEENLKSKSLSSVLKANESVNGIRFSMADYKAQKRLINVPLPLAEVFFTKLDSGKCLQNQKYEIEGIKVLSLINNHIP